MLAGRATIEKIASTEGLAERHVRRLATLGFLSPRILRSIVDGLAPSGLTVTRRYERDGMIGATDQRTTSGPVDTILHAKEAEDMTAPTISATPENNP
jgi:hypothetical protein